MPPLQDTQNQQLLNNQLVETRNLTNELIGAYRDLTNESNELFRSSEEISKLRRKDKEVAKDLFKDIERGLRAQKVNSENLITLEEKRLGGVLRLKDVNEAISKAKSRQETLVDRINEAVIENFITEAKAKDLVEAITAQYQKQEIVLKRLAKQAEELEDKLGATYAIFDGINKIPILNTLVNVQRIKSAMEDAADKTSSSLKLMSVGLSSALSQINKKLADPLVLLTAQLAILKKVYDLYGGVDQRVTDQAKQLGISKEQSEAIYQRAADYAANQRDAFVTDSRILEGRAKLNEALGMSIDFTDREAITAERLSTFYGISAEQNASLATLARQTGQANEDVLNTVVRTTNEQKRQFGGTLNTQKALQKVSSLSGEILTKFKGNVGAMTAAVMQADRLGLTLEQVDKIGESLLNFEQSIESELKAELLTGKAINIEKARAAALSGNQVELMNELATQVGDIHQFEKMNVIQRKAYADVFGMSVNEMGDMLRKKDLEAKLGVDISKSATEALRLAEEKGIKVEDSIRQELEQRSLAELQKDTFLKIRDILARITSGPMKTFYNLLESALKRVESIFGFFSKMGGGSLGNALGAVLLGAPILLGGMRLLIGTAKSIFTNGLTPFTAPWVKVANMGIGGGMGGSMGSQFAGGSFSAGKQALAQRRMMMGGGFGLAALGTGMLTSAITSGMEAGGERTTVSAIGGAATGALTGAAIGSFFPVIGTATGAIVGGLIGGIGSLVSEMQATNEQNKANQAVLREYNTNNQALLNDLALKPVNVYLGPEKVSTGLDQYGNAGKFD